MRPKYKSTLFQTKYRSVVNSLFNQSESLDTFSVFQEIHGILPNHDGFSSGLLNKIVSYLEKEKENHKNMVSS